LELKLFSDQMIDGFVEGQRNIRQQWVSSVVTAMLPSARGTLDKDQLRQLAERLFDVLMSRHRNQSCGHLVYNYI
jgi:hypothetical protein